jgi:hypothetical protein
MIINVPMTSTLTKNRSTVAYHPDNIPSGNGVLAEVGVCHAFQRALAMDTVRVLSSAKTAYAVATARINTGLSSYLVPEGVEALVLVQGTEKMFMGGLTSEGIGREIDRGSRVSLYLATVKDFVAVVSVEETGEYSPMYGVRIYEDYATGFLSGFACFETGEGLLLAFTVER